MRRPYFGGGLRPAGVVNRALFLETEHTYPSASKGHIMPCHLACPYAPPLFSHLYKSAWTFQLDSVGRVNQALSSGFMQSST